VLWQSRFAVPAASVDFFLEALEAEGMTVAAYEAPADGEAADAPWRIELLHEDEPDQRALAGKLAPLAERAGLGRLELSLMPVPSKDWLAHTRQDFAPQRVGRFWIHGSHVDEPAPPDAVPIMIDAGLAFGSGEHPTTQSCLVALDRLARHRRLGRVLDLGCGSGVLAIAAAKCWPARVVAADEDAKAVGVAQHNAGRNQVAHLVRCVQSNGLANPLVRVLGPYDLIVANILAEPLRELARDVARQIRPGGVVVLAGLLDRQADRIATTYRRCGLREIARIRTMPWTALVLSNAQAASLRGMQRWLRDAADAVAA